MRAIKTRTWTLLIRKAFFWVAGCFGVALDRLEKDPDSIVILQANHIGDLLVTTPLLAALRMRFPSSRITVAAGSWNMAVLKQNPNVDEVIDIRPPWDNAFVRPKGIVHTLKYIFLSKEARNLADRRFTIGIDVVGTRSNGLMLARMRVQQIVGGPFGIQPEAIKGPAQHMISRQLQYAELLGAKDLPSLKPQIFLNGEERMRAEALWHQTDKPVARKCHRVVIAPATTDPRRRWPADSFRKVVRSLCDRGDVAVALVGGDDTVDLCRSLASINPEILDYAGKIGLRETFGLAAEADLVICNPNMLMHVAGAFDISSIVVIPEGFESAARQSAEWGYPVSTVLGPCEGHPQDFSAAEVMNMVNEFLHKRSKEKERMTT